ncbi:RICIN domain-containing protein [Streptomyces sp. 3N207]|uniref:RICIN domain-containing protein n=1 Tax=Streptomyces sp. 3N207 TaxID=3457417 RepID=UPI003FD568C2
MLLIALPLAAFGANDDEKPKDKSEAAGMTIPNGDDKEGSYRGHRSAGDKKESTDKKESGDKKGEESEGEKGTGGTASGPDANADSAEEDKEGDSESDKSGARKPSPQRLTKLYKKLVAAPGASRGKKTLKNAMTGLCADLPGKGKGKVGGSVGQSSCHGGKADNQVWGFNVKREKAGPHNTDLFLIRNVKDGLCMDLPGSGAHAATRIREAGCNGTSKDNQLWWLEPRGGGKYWIRNHASNKQCLEIRSSKVGTRDGDAHLGTADCNRADDHAWKLVG